MSLNSRRKFLFNGSMAAAALIAAKPFASIANSISPVSGYRINNKSIILAHTGNTPGTTGNETLQQITKLKNNNANLLLLHAGSIAAIPAGKAVYDASMQDGDHFSVSANDYRIIYKGDIKTGIITADQSVSAHSINTLATYLKKEKSCHLVVCLSQLGYKSNTGLDDLSLAAASTQLDIIIGGHTENFCSRPVIVQNKNKEEVIINHAATTVLALRKIEIGFNNAGKKNMVTLTKTC